MKNLTFVALLLLSVGALLVRADVALGDVERPARRRNVSLDLRRAGLDEVLKQLSTSSGVSLRAASHLRDHRMTVLAADQNVDEARECIAQLWSLPRYPARWVKEAERSGNLLAQNPDAAHEGERL